MENKAYHDLLTQREATIIFNKGVQAAINILESVYPLSPEGVKYMIELLKEQIAESEDAYTPRLLMAMEQVDKEQSA